MKMKFWIAFFSVFLVCSLCASAEKYEVHFEQSPKYLTIAEYENERLSNMRLVSAEQGKAEFETDSSEFEVFLIYENEIVKTVANKVPENVEKEEEELPSKSFPSVYDIEKDANRAMMLVDSISLTSSDNEDFYELRAYLHGQLQAYKISEEIVISNAPEVYSHLNGESVSALQKGDVIWLVAGFDGKIKAANLLFRPLKENVAVSNADFGVGFCNLFSSNGCVAGERSYNVMTSETGIKSSGYGYAFGVVTARENAGMEIRDKSGKSLCIDIADGAIVYTCNAEERFKTENSYVSSIRKCSAARDAIDEDGSFVGWQKDGMYSYALIRTIDGEATEIIIYKNY